MKSNSLFFYFVVETNCDNRVSRSRKSRQPVTSTNYFLHRRSDICRRVFLSFAAFKNGRKTFTRSRPPFYACSIFFLGHYGWQLSPLTLSKRWLLRKARWELSSWWKFCRLHLFYELTLRYWDEETTKKCIMPLFKYFLWQH